MKEVQQIPVEVNRKDADLFASWYADNKAYLKSALSRSYMFNEDLLSEIFISIYTRILYQGVSIKDYMPYMIRAFKYRYLTHKKKASRFILMGNYEHLYGE